MENMVKNKNNFKNRTVFITGASGFLGSHLTKRALSLGAKVVGLIKNETRSSSLFYAENLDKKINLVKGDIIDGSLINSIFKNNKIDFCFHIAAQPIVGIANKSPLITFETNIKGTWNVLEALRLSGGGALVAASSDKAYGEQKVLPYKEDYPLLGLYPYDASKACADILNRCYAHTYNLPIAVTRCANLYGPGDTNFSRIIPDTILSVINGRRPIIRSDGTPMRDYLYIEDAVNGYFTLIEALYLRKIGFGEAFNFGTGKPICVLDLVNKIIRISGKKMFPEILIKTKIANEIDKQFLDSGKAKKLLKWQCLFKLEDGLKKTYQWYLKH